MRFPIQAHNKVISVICDSMALSIIFVSDMCVSDIYVYDIFCVSHNNYPMFLIFSVSGAGFMKQHQLYA